jgi:O-antigen/teichoic acid export membrane protein
MFDLETGRSPSDSRNRNGMKTRLSAILRSAGIRQSLIIGIAMILAGGLDYGVNVVAGRWLEPVEYGIFISVTAILQAMLLPAMAIRVVVAFYTVELSARGDSSSLGTFLQGVWRWAWQWGLTAAILLALVSPPLARLLRIPNSWPLWAASLMVLMLFLRESTFGALQGIQAFTGLGLVQIIQAFLRLLFAAGLILWGWRAAGAILAQPLGCVLGLGLALWWLRPHFEDRSKTAGRPVSWRYSANTLLGLGVFGVLTNLDALFVKHFFSPEMAGNYGPVVTLAKVSLFLPWAIGLVLLPKVMQRQAAGRDARPILLLALTGALAPGLGVTTLYLLSPAMLVRILFTGAYANPGIVLGLASLAATLYAGLYIWLNYALSLERSAFVYALVGVLVLQGLGMYLFGRESLVHMALAMVSASLIGNLAGFITTWSAMPKPRTVGAEVVGQ